MLIRWSPEQISGRLKLSKIYVCHETIYKWICADKCNGGILYKMLLKQHKKCLVGAGSDERKRNEWNEQLSNFVVMLQGR